MRISTWMLVTLAACSSPASNQPGVDAAPHGDGAIVHDANIPPNARTIFVIPMENKGVAQIIGNAADAPSRSSRSAST